MDHLTDESNFLSSIIKDISVDDLKASAIKYRQSTGEGCHLCDYHGHLINHEGRAYLCSCTKNKFLRSMYELAEVPNDYIESELSDWNVNAVGGNDLGSERKVSKRTLKIVEFYIKNLNNIINGYLPNLILPGKVNKKLHAVLFEGDNDSGKSFLASIMVKEAIKLNRRAKYFDWSNIVAIIGDYNQTENINKLADEFKNLDFLVIDGIEKYQHFNPPFYAQFDRLCKLRVNSGKPYMLFSNGTHHDIVVGSGWKSLTKNCIDIRLPKIVN